MAIIGKDGKPFKLSGPNPIMKEQLFWDQSKIQLINFNFPEEVVIVNKTSNPIEEEIIAPIEEIINEDEPIVEEPVEQPISIPSPPQSDLSFTSNDEPPIYSNQQKSDKMIIYCLPVFEEIVQDAVYGTKTKINKFGKKVVLEGQMINEDDLFCVFWTTSNIPLKSVIYPKNYSKRWWQVHESEQEKNGYIITAIPTHINPDFTD